MLSNTQVILVFLLVYIAMVANSFWEAYVEGDSAWDKGKLGWKIKIGKYVFSAYHFYLFGVMWPALLALPLVVYGWNLKLFGVLVSAYFSGLVIEDFMWFVVNPVFPFSKFNSKHITYYPWLKIGKLEVPAGYIISGILAFSSWYFLWR